jgi:hypothetical protein
MVGDNDVLPGKVAASPGAPPLPLARAVVGRPERAEQRDDKVFRQRVPNEPDPAPSGRGEEPRGVDPRHDGAAAAAGRPGQGRERGPAVAEAVPGVAVEGTGRGVERRRGGLRRGDPAAVVRVGERGAAGERLRRRGGR